MSTEEVYHLLAFFGGGIFAWFITFMGKTLKKRRIEQENEELMLHNEELLGLLQKKDVVEDEEYWRG